MFNASYDVSRRDKTLIDFICWCYPEIHNITLETKFGSRAILAPKNIHAEEINSLALLEMGRRYNHRRSSTAADGINEGIHDLYSVDSMVVDDEVANNDTDNNALAEDLTPEFSNSIELSGMPPHHLMLRIGAPVILLRNLDDKRGLCNGTRMQITNISQVSIGVRILNGSKEGERRGNNTTD